MILKHVKIQAIKTIKMKYVNQILKLLIPRKQKIKNVYMEKENKFVVIVMVAHFVNMGKINIHVQNAEEIQHASMGKINFFAEIVMVMHFVNMGKINIYV